MASPHDKGEGYLGLSVKRMRIDDFDEEKQENISRDSDVPMKPAEDLENEFNVPNVLNSIDDVTRWKDLGIQLELKSSKLSEIESEGNNFKLRMITQWIYSDPEASWEKLVKALTSPAMCENSTAKSIAKRRGSSFDKSITISLQTTGSNESSELLEFSEANVRNAIVNIKNTRELGERLNIPPSRLDEIDKLPPDDHKQRLVDELFKVDPDCNWKTLNAAIDAIGIRQWSTYKSLSDNAARNPNSRRLPSGGDSVFSNSSAANPPTKRSVSSSLTSPSPAKGIENANLAHLKEKAKNLENNVIRELREKRVEFKDFRYCANHFFELRLPLDGQSVESFEDYMEIAKCKGVLNLNPDTLRMLKLTIKDLWKTKELGDDSSIIKLFEDYEVHHFYYLSVTDIMTFLLQEDKEHLLLKKHDETKDKLTCTIEGIDGNTLMSYVEELWRSLELYFRINLCTAEKFLHKIELCCIKISWFVSSEITSIICERGPLSADFFTRHQISMVSINGECVYNEEIHAKLDRSKALLKLKEACESGKKMEVDSLLKIMVEEQGIFTEEGQPNILDIVRPHLAMYEWIYTKLIKELVDATKDDNLTRMKKLVCLGVDVNVKDKNDEDEWNALLWACHRSYYAIVEYLLEHGADPNAKDAKGWTGLILASRKGCFNIVKNLLDKGADVNTSNDSLWTGLMWTAQEGHTEVAKLLLERGADPTIKDKAGFTPLIQASQDGRLDVVKLLVDHPLEMDIDQRTNNDWSALMVAAKNGHVNIIHYLMDHGADMHFQKKDGVAVLHIASYKGHVDIVKILSKKNVNVNVQDEDGITPLMFAAKQGNLKTVKYLFGNKKADANIEENENQWTALFFAVEGHHQEVLEYLLRCGGDVAHKDVNGCTVVDMAKKINDEAFAYISQHHKSNLGKRKRVEKPTFDHDFYKPMLKRMTSRVPDNLRQEVMAC